MASAPPPKLWIPPSLDERPRPFKCNLCGQRFADRDGAFVAHVEKCYASIEPEIQEAVAAHSAEMRNMPDPEWYDYNESLKAQGLDPEIQYARGRKSNVRRARES